MSAALARNHKGLQSRMSQVGHWPTLSGWFGFDPFQHLRASYNFEYDVTRRQDGYEVEVPVPGYTSDQIEVALNDHMLSVSGKNDRRSFARSLMIPDDVDVQTVDARVQNGMLHLFLKRHPQAQPKKIDVN